ncbi:metallophosphoesterase [Methanobacterium paludis]|uniref:Metallophosphoesterase n=1 Tax=Methanobacterium paludis (strain DSM 25820 / JCM 18151 / SWAN1) TaxID=868131 RepID=F6D2E2_METPW|nr:metallophosphoesterase [Methanobacterium paludis]AEG19074.1 metallophosphoesterase [Methanobacterium paludis]
MRRILQFASFLSLFFVGFLALNYFVFYGMAFLLGMSQNIIFYILMFTAAASYPVATLIEKTVSNNLTRIFYAAASAWMGISFYLLFFLVIYGILSFFVKIPHETAGIIIGILTLALSIYSIVNSLLLNTKEINIHITGLNEDLKVVQLSDIHIGSIRNSGYMEKIVAETNKLKPDIVLITGDMVDGSARLHTHTFKSINDLDAPVFFVTGNHDFYEGLDEVFRVLKDIKIKILCDEMVECCGLQIVGVNYSFKKDHLKKVLSQLDINNEKPSVLLYHLPRGLKTANEAGVDLQLSGHTHKGQMFPFNFLVKLMFPYVKGIYEYNGAQLKTYLYVSPGTGTWGPPMRLGSKCEITLINLRSGVQG